MVEKLVTHLEMVRREQLSPAKDVPGLVVDQLRDTAGQVERIRRLHDAIATPHHWSSLARDWSSEATADVLSDPARSDWIATVGGRDVGWGALVEGEGGVEIAVFGVRADAVGHGYGGAFLTSLVRKAWDRAGPGCRVWLHTSSWDHPHARRNYRARGFTVERLELQDQTGPAERTSAVVDAPPRFLVRPAVPIDASAVAELLDALGHPLPLARVRERLERFSASRDDVVAVVAEGGERVVGVTSAHVVPAFAEERPGFLRITALSVSPDRPRRGIGRRLVAFLEYAAREHGCELLEVSSGRRPERAGARRFYPALGFVDSADRAVRYWKALDPQ